MTNFVNYTVTLIGRHRVIFPVKSLRSSRIKNNERDDWKEKRSHGIEETLKIC